MSWNASNHQIRKLNGVFQTHSVEEIVQEMLKLGIQPTLDLALYTCDPDRGAIVEMHPHGFWKGGKVGMDEGGNIVNQVYVNGSIDSNLVSGDKTIYTVTAGKTLYVTHLAIATAVAGTDGATIKDGTTVVAAAYFAQYAMVEIVKGLMPLKFTTSVVYDGGGSGSEAIKVTLIGWEE